MILPVESESTAWSICARVDRVVDLRWGTGTGRVICVATALRLYDSAMATQITVKTEGPHGLPSGRRTEVDSLYPGLII